jgi:hypothetical protein
MYICCFVDLFSFYYYLINLIDIHVGSIVEIYHFIDFDFTNFYCDNFVNITTFINITTIILLLIIIIITIIIIIIIIIMDNAMAFHRSLLKQQDKDNQLNSSGSTHNELKTIRYDDHHVLII